MRQKWKRKSGWITPISTLKIKKEEIFEKALEPKIFYDDWENFRDSFRDWYSDFKKIKKIDYGKIKFKELLEKRIRMNEKQKRLLIRRKVRRKIYKDLKN
ncbi:MAG: hypothetical protein KJ674_03200 [Nanoarchaeota archaeon]|nr:hypothetical protein [Nanoarchaeota archaeon]